MQPMATSLGKVGRGFRDTVVEALRGYTNRSDSDKPMLGWTTLEDKNLDRVAERLLARYWGGKKAIAGLFEMAMSIEDLLGLVLLDNDRWHLGRYLLGAMCYSGLYRLERESEADDAPYTIVAIGNSLRKTDIDRTRLEPFPLWDRNFDAVGNQLIRSSRPVPAKKEWAVAIPKDGGRDGDPSPWLYAVHKIEHIPFRVNKDMLALVEQLDQPEESDADALYRIVPKKLENFTQDLQVLLDEHERENIGALDELYNEDEENLKQWSKKRKDLQKRNKELKEAKKNTLPLPDRPKRKLDPESDDGKKRAKYWRKRILLKEAKLRVESRRRKFESELENAQKYRDAECFYHRVSVDYRGRIYLPSSFSYQGSDLARSLIEFADGEPVNAVGFSALCQHNANTYGYEASPQDKRETGMDFDIANTAAYIALYPEETFDQWKTTDKPYCYLRSCLDIRDCRAVEAPKIIEELELDKEQSFPNEEVYQFHKKLWPALVERRKEVKMVDDEFVSHLPVELDQSNSAFAHIAGMMNDDDLRRQANHGETYSDLYNDAADSLRLTGPETDEKRKIVKLVAVPWGYGAGSYTCANRLREFREQSPHKAKWLRQQTSEEITILTTNILRHLERKFKTCVRYRDRIYRAIDEVKERADKEIKEKKTEETDAVIWTTASYFPVLQQVYRARELRGEVFNGQKGDDAADAMLRTKRSTDIIAWDKHKTKAPPNLVHSYDAALIHAVLWAGRFSSVKLDSREQPYLLPAPEQADEKAGTVEGTYMYRYLEERFYEPRYPIVTIHDAFGVHARHFFDLENKLVLGMATLYAGFDPLTLFTSEVEKTSYNKRRIWDSDWFAEARNAFG